MLSPPPNGPRRSFLALFATGALETSTAQVPRRLPRIAVPLLDEGTAEPLLESLQRGMREQGVLDRDVVYDVAYAGGQVDRIPKMIGELLARQPDVVVVGSPAFLRAVLQQTTTVPIVMANVSDPVGNKFIHSLSRPGTSVTGVATLYEEVVPKVVEALHLLAPSATQIGVLVNEFNPSAPALVSAAQQAFRSLGKTATPHYASSLPQVEAAFKRMQDARVRAGLVIMDPVFFFLRSRIVSLARDLAVPFAYGSREYVDAGGLVSYGPNLPANFRASARYVAQILKGAQAADLPVEMPPRFELVLNLKSGEALQIVIPPSVLVRAEVV